MRHSIFGLVITFILLFCLGCGSAGDLYEDTSMQEGMPNTGGNSQEGDLSGPGLEDSVQIGAAFNEEQENDMETEPVEYVSVRTERIFDEYVDRDSGNFLVDMNYYVLSLEDGNEALEQTLSKWMIKRQQDLEEDGLKLMITVRNKQKETGNENLTASVWHEITLYRVDNRLISFLDRQYTYAIDTWDVDYRCVNFDAQSGKNILLDDLLVDKDGFRDAVLTYCIDKLEKMYTNCEIDDTFVEQIYKSIASIENWCLDASGFVFVYEDDAMKYSNEGVLYVHVPYEEVFDYVNPEYLWGDTYGIAALVCDETAAVVVDGVNNQVCVEKQYDEYYIEELRLTYGNTVVDMKKHVRTNSIYLMRHENWNYLAVSVDMASDDYQTYFYELKKNAIGQTFCLDGNLDVANVRADSFYLQKRVNVLGTYQTYPEYIMLKEGSVALKQAEFTIEHSNYDFSDLVTIRELPVMRESEKVYVPAGTRMRIASTDNASWAKFLLPDIEEEVVVYFEREEDGTISIEGVSEYEYFEMLPYVG